MSAYRNCAGLIFVDFDTVPYTLQDSDRVRGRTQQAALAPETLASELWAHDLPSGTVKPSCSHFALQISVKWLSLLQQLTSLNREIREQSPDLKCERARLCFFSRRCQTLSRFRAHLRLSLGDTASLRYQTAPFTVSSLEHLPAQLKKRVRKLAASQHYVVLSRDPAVKALLGEQVQLLPPLFERTVNAADLKNLVYHSFYPQFYRSFYCLEELDQESLKQLCPATFYKVIFLDIDGVLNNDHTSDSPVICPEMVAQLKYLVEATGADLILSSSWRYDFLEMVKNGYRTEDKELKLLRDTLKSCGLCVRGIVPLTPRTGPRSRPYEIRQWLLKFHQTRSFVILDDDSFWTWGCLQRNVVTTKTRILPQDADYRGFNDEWRAGLTRAHAEAAIGILNDQGALPGSANRLD